MKPGKNDIQQLTPQQYLAVNIWVEGGRRSKAGALRKAGYSEAVAHQPHKVFGSTVVRMELERRGYDDRGVRIMRKEKGMQVMEKIESQAPTFDPSLLSEKQIFQLKEMLAEIPDIPISPYRGMAQEEISSYVPKGGGVDAFSVEAKEVRAGGHLDFDNFSSM